MKGYKDAQGGFTQNVRKSPLRIPMQVPCQQCIECRIKRVGDWAARMMHETKSHMFSCYLTLTYDPEHLPPGATLVVRDVQLFHKRLHNRLLKKRGAGNGIKFFYSGEYGERTGRPHYHSIVWKYRPSDLKFYKYNKQGDPLYKSEELQELWKYGDVTVGDVTFASCSYVAGYVVDKITGKMAEDYYWRFDPRDGREYAVLPEFSRQSNGIGREWFNKFYPEWFRDDAVVIDERKRPIPRYYDLKYEAIDPEGLKALKDLRRRAAEKHVEDRSTARSRVKEAVALSKLRLKGRTL